MNSVTKYVLGIVALAGAIFFSWYFFSVIVYILVAAVISFIGRPIIDLLGRVKIRGYRLPDGLKAGITVICLWGLFILFFSTIIPLAIREFQSLGNVSVSNIVSELESPIEDAGHFMKHYGLMDEDQDVDAYVTDLLSKVFNVGQLKTWFGTVAGTMTDIFVALFSITFILFFFLKDSRLFSGMVMAVLPSRFEEQARNALDSIQKLLVRYFVGLLLEVLGVMALNTIGLTIVGLGFKDLSRKAARRIACYLAVRTVSLLAGIFFTSAGGEQGYNLLQKEISAFAFQSASAADGHGAAAVHAFEQPVYNFFSCKRLVSKIFFQQFLVVFCRRFYKTAAGIIKLLGHMGRRVYFFSIFAVKFI